MDEDGRQCPVCLCPTSSSELISFSECRHSFCKSCVKHTFELNISEARVDIQCLFCKKPVHANEIASVVEPRYFVKYLDFSLRRYLSLQPNVLKCTAPDCPYSFILENRSSCTDDHFVCRRAECGREFCVRCKRPWHGGKTCQQARREVALDIDSLASEDLSLLNIKPCPRCKTKVEKLEDGSCNQIHCTNCERDFCWLCLQPITEMHFLSPTGCPLYGHKRWSTGKKWCCRIGLWCSAPLLLILLSVIVFWLVIVLFPLLIGYLVYRSKRLTPRIKVVVMIITILLSVLASPFVAFAISFIVVPLGLLYIYCIIPIHLSVTGSSRRADMTTLPDY